MAFPYIFFSIESSKVNDVGDFDLLFLFDIAFFCPCLNHNCHRLDLVRLDHDRVL